MHSTFIRGNAGSIEARILEPDGAPRSRAVVAHPHPLYGGTMDNAVVRCAAECLRDAGALVLTFNYRGVGKSTGSFDEGAGELDDLVAAEWHLAESLPRLPSCVVGYSFGAALVLRRLAGAAQAEAPSMERAVLVAPPLAHLPQSREPIASDTASALIWGSQDALTPPRLVEQLAERIPNLRANLRLENVGHDLGTATTVAASLQRAFAHALQAIETPTPAEGAAR